MSYLGRSAKLSLKAQEKVSFLATAGQTVKTGLSYTPSFVEVYVNGVLLTDTTDFTATNGNSITFTVALLLNDEVTVISLKTFTVADHYSKTEADTLLSAKATNTALALKAPIASPVFTGNVGIGVTPESTWHSTHTVLQLGDRGALLDDAGGVTMMSNSYYDSGWKYLNTDLATMYESKSGTHKFNVAPSGTADSAISWNTAMTIDNAGIVTKPLQPAFSVALTSDYSIVTGDTTLGFGTERFDNNADFNVSTYRFVAPVTGKYQFNVELRINDMTTATAYYRIKLQTSNQLYQTAIIDPDVFTQNSTYFPMSTSVLADMDAGDEAYVVFNASGATGGTVDNQATNSHFSGFLAC